MFLLKGPFDINDLFCGLFSTARNRGAHNFLFCVVARAISLGASTILNVSMNDFEGGVLSINDFVEKYGIGCKMKLCDDFKPSEK